MVRLVKFWLFSTLYYYSALYYYYIFAHFSSLAVKQRDTLKSPALAFLKLNMYAYS